MTAGLCPSSPSSRTPSVLFQRAGVVIGGDDGALNNGIAVTVDQPIPPGEAIHLEVVRATPILINGQAVLTAAQTVGEALRQQGFELLAMDLVDPPVETRLSPGLLVSVVSAKGMAASADATSSQIQSKAGSIGASLAEAGIPLEGMDIALPSEEQAATDGGEARIERATESLALEQQTIPYASVTTDSPELEVGLEQVLQPGSPGLAVTRIRVRRQDSREISRVVSPRSLVLEPQDRVVLLGTKLVERTESIDGVSITYWRSLQMYATIYSPCNSGTSNGACSTGTASGRPAGKGVVAVDPGLYAYLNGQRLYIPGYGFAVVGDIGGGYIVEQQLGISRYKWIDLGFDDNNLQDMTGWISVYFLSPAPASIPDVLR